MIPVFFAFATIAILPPVILFTVFKPFGAAIVSSGWLALALFTFVVFAIARKPRIRPSMPAAEVLKASLGLKAQNDRVLAGDVEGLAVQAIWTPSHTRIDVHVGTGLALELDGWFASLTSDQRVAMFEAVGNSDAEVRGGELQIRVPLSFRVPEHGADLEYRIRDAVKLAKVLLLAGTPPQGCVGRLRNERAAAATPGTLAIAAPAPADGAVSIAVGEGNVSLANAKKQPT